MSTLLSVVVPVYNEEGNIPTFLSRIRPILANITPDYEVIFCADPCTDWTIEILRQAHREDPRIKTLSFSRRFGQPAATMGGIYHAAGRAAIVIDVDLQDPPELVTEMVRLWRDEGYKVVIPQRTSREGEHPLKKLIAFLGYWFINKISQVKIPRNTGDFRLLDRCVIEELKRLKESHGFLRGLVAVVGFKTKLLPFERQARHAGDGNYNRITGSLRIGFNGIICFSDYLLNAMIKLGLAMAAGAFLSTLVIIFMKFGLHWEFASGVPSIMCLILFVGGAQLVGMGILGAYLGRVYDEAKERPLFIVEEGIGLTPVSGHPRKD